MMNKPKSSLSLAWNTHFFVIEHFRRTIFINVEKTQKQSLACYEQML